MSLRVKFLGLLVVIPSLCLGLFLYFAVTTFISDKTNYLFENQFQLLNSASLLFSETNLNPENTQSRIDSLLKQEGFENLLILNDKGLIQFSQNTAEKNSSLKDVLGNSVFDKLINQKTGEGSFEAIDKVNENRIISFLRIPLNNEPSILVLHTLKSGSTRASLIFFLKSISAFIALLSLSALISLIFSNKLTLGIRTLSKAMKEFGQGNVDSPLPPRSNDEVGQMSQQFSQMREQISHLLIEKENKTKIETEMQLAGELQKRFFPAENYQNNHVDLTGYFEPAHDAGGDWWFYFEQNKKLIFLIGDVTGHGLNSAMITGVSRSVFSLIEDQFKGPGESLRLLNRAIYDAASGQLNMTCFVGCLDTETGELTYSNASHEPPYVLPPIEKSLKMNDLDTLDSASGPRLGEQKSATYTEATIRLEKNTMIFLYSDGLTELRNSSDEMLGERKLIAGFGKGHSTSVTSENMIQKVKNLVTSHRQSCELNDDLSYMALKWRSL